MKFKCQSAAESARRSIINMACGSRNRNESGESKKEVICGICGKIGWHDNMKANHFPNKHPGQLYCERGENQTSIFKQLIFSLSLLLIGWEVIIRQIHLALSVTVLKLKLKYICFQIYIFEKNCFLNPRRNLINYSIVVK